MYDLGETKSDLGFFDLLNMMQISDLHQQASIFTYKKSLLWPNGQKISEKKCRSKKIAEMQMKKNIDLKFKYTDLKWSYQNCKSVLWVPVCKKNCSQKGVHMRKISWFENRCYCYFSWIAVARPKIKWLYILLQMSDLDETKADLGVFWPSKCDANIRFAPANSNLHL